MEKNVIRSEDERKEIIENIINIAMVTPGLSPSYVALLLKECNPEINVYERIGVNLISSKLESLAESSELFALALSLVVDEETGATIKNSIDLLLG